jgi:hypothetical protein
MSTPYCFVTVQTPRRRVDLTLPTNVPVVELTPSIAQLCAAEAGDHPAPAWTLGRVGSPAVSLDATLADAEVRDGDVLHLVAADRWRGPVVVDVAETVTQAVESMAAPRWSAGARSWVCAGLAVAHLVAGALLAAVSGDVALWTLPAAALAVAMIGAPHAAPQLVTIPAARTACAAGGLGFAALAGWAGAAAAASTSASVTALCAALALACAATTPTVPAVSPALGVVAAGTACAAGAVTAGATPVDAAAAVVVAGLLALRLLPRTLARRLSGRVAGRDAASVVSSARNSLRLLSSLATGLATCVAAAAVVLALHGAASAALLVALAGVSLLLRAHSFRFVSEVAPLTVAAGVALLVLDAAVGTRLLDKPGASIGVLLLTAGALLALSSRRHVGPTVPFRINAAAVSRVVDAALLPIALASMGVFEQITRAAQSLGH